MLPIGTVTFLFTDIQGSTPLWEREPEKMAAELQIHNTALRRPIETNGGVVFKIVGDAFQASFPTATQALRAAIEGQRLLQSAPWNELGPLKVRMGLLTGEAEFDPAGDEYAVSHTKNRAARIMSAAHGGQILLSQEAKDLVERGLPEGTTLKDLGEHHLKGMQKHEHLYQVVTPGLLADFPPLATSVQHLNNLPVQLTSFIGREREIGELTRLLEKQRLVTLTGSGGTGKTRLALQVAASLLDAFPDGVWLVELVPLADPLMVPQTIIAALGLIEQSGKTPSAFLADYLRQKRALLILDNCEHLVAACAELATALLHSAPRLTILATSREFMGVADEMPYRVPPLGMPDLRHLPPLEELACFDAVRLFVERARVVDPAFTLTDDNAGAVAQITQRLDGIPLALELAAARVRLMSVGQIALRLNDAFRLLTGGSRTALPRHQTLQALIDWSYNLLSESERGLLRSLSAFAGGWTLDAAEEVCGEAQDVLELVGQLADKSLILVGQVPGGEMRYRMLETVRQYAHARLVDAGEAEVVRQRPLAYYLHLAEMLEPKLRGREQIRTLDELGRELDNLRLALETALQTDIEAELRLAAALHWFWHIRYHWKEGISWLERGLETEALSRGGQSLTGSRAVIRAKALTALGFTIYRRDFSLPFKAQPILEEALLLYQASGIEYSLGLAWTLICLGGCRLRLEGCDPVQARALVEEALSLFHQIGDPHGMAESLQILGFEEVDPARRKKYHREQLAIEEANEDIQGIATALFNIGNIGFRDCDYTSAYTAFEASRGHFRRGATWISLPPPDSTLRS